MRSKLTYVLTGLVAAIVAFLLMRGGDQGPPIWQNGGRLVTFDRGLPLKAVRGAEARHLVVL